MGEKFTFIHDGRHGWLKVPSIWIHKLGMRRSISPFSYISKTGDFVYLEEDLDAALFISTFKLIYGKEPDINDIEVDVWQGEPGLSSYRTRKLETIKNLTPKRIETDQPFGIRKGKGWHGESRRHSEVKR